MLSRILFPLVLCILLPNVGHADPNVDIGPVLSDWAQTDDACNTDNKFRIFKDVDFYTLQGPKLVCVLLDVTKTETVYTFVASCGESEETKLKDFKDQTIRMDPDADFGVMDMEVGGVKYELVDCQY